MVATRKGKYSTSFGDCLRQILLGINAAEGHTDTDMETTVVTKLRDALYELKNVIGAHPDYSQNNANEQLMEFDKVFTDCGWDNQGFRFTKEKPDDEGEDIFVVLIEYPCCECCGQRRGAPVFKPI